MSITCDTSHWSISTVPAAPQSTVGLEQQATPRGSLFVASTQLSTAALSAARSGNVHPVLPETGSSPAALVPPPVHGKHILDCTRSSARQGMGTHLLGGPSVDLSSRSKRLSHAVAPLNMPPELISEMMLQLVMSW